MEGSQESIDGEGGGVGGGVVDEDYEIVDVIDPEEPFQEEFVDLSSSPPPVVNQDDSIQLVESGEDEDEGDEPIINGDISVSPNHEPAALLDPPPAGNDVVEEEVITIDDDGTSGSGDSNGAQNRGVKRKRFSPYTQDLSCWRASKFLPRCRDCADRGITDQVQVDDVCRFHQFRKLVRKAAPGSRIGFYVEFAGFCDPIEDSMPEDKVIYVPNPSNPPIELPQDVCLQLLDHLGDQVCALISQEQEALQIEQSLEKEGLPTAWKRLVEGVREMCDVCVTTLFNYHWICPDCGFVACLDCFKSRKEKEETERAPQRDDPKKDGYKWLLCTKEVKKGHRRNGHELRLMQLTQIIPSDCLQQFNKALHEVRSVWQIPQNCGCPYTTGSSSNGTDNQIDIQANDVDMDASTTTTTTEEPHHNGVENIQNKKAVQDDSDDSDEDEDICSTLSFTVAPRFEGAVRKDANGTNNGLPGVTELNKPDEQKKDNTELTHYVRPKWNSYYTKKSVPRKIYRLADTMKLYNGLKHTWLCEQSLLRLEDPDHELNGGIFQDVWKRGQPVLVSNVAQKLNSDLWSPEAFLKDYGDQKNDLINCLTGRVVPQESMANFWEGFSDVSKRLEDQNGIPMLLKLKDWPATEDFAKFCPKRFDDLMQALPLKDYTQRTGRLNLAARLPNNFIRPDLGPKMYIAYGDGTNLEKGTTVLHLDISDAVNCMVFVGRPENADPEHDKAVHKAIKESDCDVQMIERVMKNGELPGALWHIYRPWDTDKIRDLLNKVSIEQGNAPQPNHDPIHDQVMYLDAGLRRRLREEYDVVGFPIVQCAGDAVFIPAGAPHQVRNLHNCIKIAEDFVSPENVSHCFQLTEEFRNLSDTHSNHEDKLQIKNIVYHAVKDAMSVLMNARPIN